MKYFLLGLLSLNLANAQKDKVYTPSPSAIKSFMKAYNSKITNDQKFKDEKCSDGDTREICKISAHGVLSADREINSFLKNPEQRTYFARVYQKNPIVVKQFIDDAEYALKNRRENLSNADKKRFQLFEQNLNNANAYNAKEKEERIALEKELIKAEEAELALLVKKKEARDAAARKDEVATASFDEKGATDGGDADEEGYYPATPVVRTPAAKPATKTFVPGGDTSQLIVGQAIVAPNISDTTKITNDQEIVLNKPAVPEKKPEITKQSEPETTPTPIKSTVDEKESSTPVVTETTPATTTPAQTSEATKKLIHSLAENCLNPETYDGLPTRYVAIKNSCGGKEGLVRGCIRYVECTSKESGEKFLRQALCQPKNCGDAAACVADKTTFYTAEEMKAGEKFQDLKEYNINVKQQ